MIRGRLTPFRIRQFVFCRNTLNDEWHWLSLAKVVGGALGAFSLIMFLIGLCVDLSGVGWNDGANGIIWQVLIILSTIAFILVAPFFYGLYWKIQTIKNSSICETWLSLDKTGRQHMFSLLKLAQSLVNDSPNFFKCDNAMDKAYYVSRKFYEISPKDAKLRQQEIDDKISNAMIYVDTLREMC